MSIKVTIKNVYGEERIYPACEHASIFTIMLGQQTLTRQDIGHIKALGYTVEVVQDKVSL